MNQDLLNLLKQRRSIYALGKDVKQNPDDLVDLIETVIQETPTAFNSQTTRAVFLFGEQHDKLWDIVVKRLESEVPTEQAYEATKQKIASFKAAYGTIMYFTDTDVVKQLENDFPLYAANFYMRQTLRLGQNRRKVPHSSTHGSPWRTMASARICSTIIQSLMI